MSFKDLDYLSPKIALFYYGRRRHSSLFGGILTIIMIFFCLIYIINSFLQVYLHTTSTIQYYRHFFKDKDNYLFNDNKGIFHYFQIYNPINNSYISSFNSKYIRLFMSNIQEEYKINPEILSEFDHWVYDDCRDGIDNKFLSKDLFKDISFENGLCLRYYYNSKNKIYYPIDDIDNFIYPNISSSGLNMDYSIGTIIEKCNNNSVLTNIFGYCGEEVEIDNYFKDNFGINIHILTHEINISNYGNQINNYIYGISNPLKKNKIIENKIVLSPLKTDIRGGIFYSSRSLNKTYSFNENYITDEERKENSRILSIYNFCLAQSGYIYKSTFLTIYDSFPKIGGIIQVIYYIFFGINFIYNRYKIIDDTKTLFFTLYNDEKKNEATQIQSFSKITNDIRKKKNMISRNNINNNNVKIFFKNNTQNNVNQSRINNNYFINNDFNFHKISNNFNDDSFFQKNLENDKSLAIFPFISDKEISMIKSNQHILNISSKKLFSVKSDFIQNKEKNTKEENQKSNIEYKNNIDIKKEYNNNDDNNNESKKKNEFIQIKNILNKFFDKNENVNSNVDNNNNKDNDVFFFKLLIQKYFNYKKQSFIYEKISPNEIGKYFSFGKYFYSFCCNKKQKNIFNILNRFRKKLLSEEHFFRTHNYFYLVEKYFDIQETQKIDIVELYKNL